MAAGKNSGRRHARSKEIWMSSCRLTTSLEACLPMEVQTLIAFFVSFFGPLLLLPVFSPLHAFACISRRSFWAPESGLPPIGVACEIVSRDERGPVDKPVICSKGLPFILGRRLFNL